MTVSDSRSRRAGAARGALPPELSAPAPALRLLLEAGVTVRARRRQRLALSLEQSELLYVVRSGVLLLSASLPGKRRELLTILYPGDVFRTSFAPLIPDISLMAATAVEASRLRWSAAEQLMQNDSAVGRYLARATAALLQRQTMHIAAIGALTGEERAASFLVDAALRLGATAGEGIAFELPLTRSDIADHLSLNADTLSRIMSRLKGSGIFHTAGRRRVVISDWQALCALTPIADMLRDQQQSAGASAA